MTSKKTLSLKKIDKKATTKPAKKPVRAVPKVRYVFALGRRKTADAKVKLWKEGSGEFKVNDRDLANYFPTMHLQKAAVAALETTGLLKKVDIAVKAAGGGVAAQAQAVGLGVSRALIKADPALRSALKKQGLLRRDARKKERKKPGLKRARRAPQWQKR